MDPVKCTVLIGLLVGLRTTEVHSAKILTLPVSRQVSHILELINVAIPLMDQGHEVTMVVPQKVVLPDKVEKSNIRIVRWKFTQSEHGLGAEAFEENMKKFFDGKENTIMTILKTWPENMQNLRDECHGLLGDSVLDKKLQAEKFDLAIIDGWFLSRCVFLIPHRMGVPYVGFSALVPRDIMSTTYILASIEPAEFLPFGLAMTFFQRLGNLFLGLIPYYFMDYFAITASEFQHYAHGRSFDSMSALVKKSELWLVNQHSLLDLPKPRVPFLIPIGGINASPPKPLPSTLGTFADQSKDGMIVISFGSSIDQLQQNFLDSLIEAAKQLPSYHFLLRSKTSATELPRNVMMVKWIPQNDALGHPKTRLFITHCGNGGQLEALYHGVPMLGFPGIADQFHNAARMVQHGYGLRMNLGDFTTEELIQNLNLLLLTDTYRNKIKQASKIMQDPINGPNKTVVYWIDHILKYGGDHLKIQSDLYGFQILMWDVFLFLMIFFVFIIWIDVKLLFCCYRRCCKRRKPRSKKKKA